MGFDRARCRYETSSDSALAGKGALRLRSTRRGIGLTFTEISNSFAIDRGSMLVNIRRQEVIEVSHD